MMPCHAFRLVLLAIALLTLSACSILSRQPSHTPGARTTPAPASQTSKGGGYYKDDGPGDSIPGNLDDIPDAIPRIEPLHKGAIRPYTVLGKNYTPQTRIQSFRQEGVASWYGKKFHGQKTSTGETYDMFAMSAAHPTLALPSYARISNPANKRSVIVRVNDRGPFHSGRVIDLSYTAAYKLGYLNSGSTRVVVESIVPGTPLFAALAAGAPATTATTATSTATAPVPIYTPAPVSSPASQPAPQPDTQALDALAQHFSNEDFSDEGEPPTEGQQNPVLSPTVTFASSIPEHGFFLQLGAFSLPDNAEALKNRLLRELDWLPGPVFIHNDGRLYRLQTGPYPDRATAEENAERIRADFGYSPALVIRSLRER